MAEESPAKKLRRAVTGKICNVSPLKDTKEPYFEATLQHKGKSSTVMVYRPEEHVYFQHAEKTQSPVTLQNVIIPQTKSNETTNMFYTHESNISCVRDLTHAFENTAEAQNIQLSELPKLDIKPQKVNINVKIILEEFKGNNVVWDGRYLPITVYTVADTTGYSSLAVWDDENVTVGEWYKITNVSIKEFKGKNSLSTTIHTKISNIPSQGAAIAVEVPTVSIKCEIIGVNINYRFICHRKHIVLPLSPKVYCDLCKTHYKTTAIIMKISGHLDLKLETGNIIKASVGDQVIRSAVDVKPDASEDDIIQGLMSLPLMQMTICKDVILKMEESTSQNNLNHRIQSEQMLVSRTSPAVVEPDDDSVEFYSPPDLGLFNSQPQKRK